MSPKRPPRFHLNVALCFVAMTAAAALVLAWLGLSPLTVILAATAAGCLGAMAYAWWLGGRALKPLDRAGRSGARRTP